MVKVEELVWKYVFLLFWEFGDMVYINNLCLMYVCSVFDVDEEGNLLFLKCYFVKLMLQDLELVWEFF